MGCLKLPYLNKLEVTKNYLKKELSSKNSSENGYRYLLFGSTMPGRTFSAGSYRFGFNGMEKDDEMKGEGNSLDFGARIYDSRLGRWLSTDAFEDIYSGYSPYNFALNTPIQAIDPDGNYVYFLNKDEAQLMADDLNREYKDHYGYEGTAFKVVTVVEIIQIENPNYVWWNPLNKEPEYISKEEVRHKIIPEKGFDWNTDKYTKAIFDIMMTNKAIKQAIVPSTTPIQVMPMFPTVKTPIKDLKGWSFDKTGLVWYSRNLEENYEGWSLAGTFLHENLAHYHFIGSTESSSAMQSHYGFKFSKLNHAGEPKMRWSNEEIERLSKLREEYSLPSIESIKKQINNNEKKN